MKNGKETAGDTVIIVNLPSCDSVADAFDSSGIHLSGEGSESRFLLFRGTGGNGYTKKDK